MPQVMATVDVDVPVRTAYDQWTQFEEFPEFLSFVDSITQQDDTHLHWTVDIAGVKREFDAEISEQLPDDRIAWHSTSGDVQHAGVVTFHRLDDDRSRVAVQIDWDAAGFAERAGAALGIDGRVIEADLERFKRFIESRGEADGAWRGTVA